MDFQPQDVCLGGSGGQTVQLEGALSRIGQMTIATGMELDHLGAHGGGGLDLGF
ncbi:hypothetical protein D3C85_1608180 [compost metagenome]